MARLEVDLKSEITYGNAYTAKGINRTQSFNTLKKSRLQLKNLQNLQIQH